MKKFIRFLVAGALLCGSLVAKDITKDTLIVGTNAEYPPFEFVDENSKVTGFDMDLVAELAKRAGVKYEILNMSFDGLIPAIKSGKIDVKRLSISQLLTIKSKIYMSSARMIAR